MAKLKYEKYILMEPPVMKYKREANTPELKQVLMLNGENVEGAFHVNCMWVPVGHNPGVYEAHKHPHDEVIGFIGTNPDDPSDLGAVAELWIEDEQYFINKSFMAYFPKGLVHCPLYVPDVKRPIFHFDIQLATGRPEFEWVKKNTGAKK
jgi:hypothetical protein